MNRPEHSPTAGYTKLDQRLGKHEGYTVYTHGLMTKHETPECSQENEPMRRQN